MLASTGQGRLDMLPAGDLAYIKLVGPACSSGGDPWARATEAEVDAFFAPYHPWGALAGAYALRAPVPPRIRIHATIATTRPIVTHRL